MERAALEPASGHKVLETPLSRPNFGHRTRLWPQNQIGSAGFIPVEREARSPLPLMPPCPFDSDYRLRPLPTPCLPNL